MASTHKILPAGSGPTSIARIRMPPPPLQRFQPWNSRECTSHSVFSLAPLGRQIEWPSRYATARFRWVFAETTSVRLFRTRLLRMDRLSTWRYPSRSNQKPLHWLRDFLDDALTLRGKEETSDSGAISAFMSIGQAIMELGCTMRL